MYLGEHQEEKTYIRTSKLGTSHEYTRLTTVASFRCDNCGELFTRPRGNISPKRLSNMYFHCCPNCDSKRFAQKKGAERRTIWDMPASSMADISRL
jgi:Zn finger protein HypA/HybF involved in hydrogenase expression